MLKTGSMSIIGELLEFDGESYLLKSKVLGTVQVSTKKFHCLGSSCPDIATVRPAQTSGPALRITGSSSIGSRLIPALTRHYAASMGAAVESAEKPDGDAVLDIVRAGGEKTLTIQLNGRTSAEALLALKSGAADIAMTDRPITPAEIRAFTQAGFPDMNRPGHEYLVALDAVVVFISPQNPLDTLPTEDVSRIFAGEITDWSELGAPPARINIYAADDDTETSRTFQSVLLQRYNRNLTPNARHYQSIAELAKAVAADPAGIGFASFAEIDIAKPLALKEPCGLLLRPSKFSVKSGEYPLSRKLYLYTAKRNNQQAAEYLDYALSPTAASSLNEAGLIDTGPAMVHFAHCQDRVIASMTAAPENFNLDLMRQLMATLKSAHRVSATMQFEAGSAQLDSESVQLLPRIAAHLKQSDRSGRRILLVGYSDSSGVFENNRELALKRATTVRDALVTVGKGGLKPDDIHLQAYSELFPVACNITKQGRQKNRRVEIWLVPQNHEGQPVRTTQH